MDYCPCTRLEEQRKSTKILGKYSQTTGSLEHMGVGGARYIQCWSISFYQLNIGINNIRVIGLKSALENRLYEFYAKLITMSLSCNFPYCNARGF
jgi:hypothetical protein